MLITKLVSNKGHRYNKLNNKNRNPPQVKQKSGVTCKLAPYAKSSCKVGKKKVLQAVSLAELEET